ncbi:MAG: DM13 domain-containing protein [Actinomycetota bacterium]|nr:DM13 domain-containing protein [Actinomycetota bacterium]
MGRRRWRGRRVWGLVALVLAAVAACGQSGPPPRAAPTTPPSVAPPQLFPDQIDHGPRAAPRWDELASFSGTGPTETQGFAIAPGAIQWRARYQCESGALRLEVRPSPDEPEPLAEATCPTEGEGFAISSGEHRLAVATPGPWRVTVEQQVETPIDEAPLPGMTEAPVLAEGSFYEIDEPGSGTVRLFELADGTRALRLEDFEVFLNTDLVVWLSEAPNPSTSAEAVAAPHVEIADLKSTIGPQNYLVPADLPTERIRSVIIWCPPIRSAYLAASLSP